VRLASSAAFRTSRLASTVLAAAFTASGLASGASHYVSKGATGAGTGRSWADAWGELDRINWAAVSPGDTIYLDGGPGGKTYETTLSPARSGAAGAPIRIWRSEEPGRDGTVTFYGGDPVPLPHIGQSHSTPAGARDRGIYLGAGRGYIEVDGRRWCGIRVYGYRGSAGVYMYDSSSASYPHHITLRNMEIFDCGVAGSSEGKGIRIAGDWHHFERLLVHDCEQDAIQGRGVNHFRMTRCWLYNARPKANDPQNPFNAGRHHDAVQIFSGGLMQDYVVEDTIIGPNFNQGFFPTETGTKPTDVTLRNCLFIGNKSDSQWQGCLNKDTQNVPLNWTWEGCTFWARHQGAETNHILVRGTGHAVRDSIFYDGRTLFSHEVPTHSNNMQFKDYSGNYRLGVNADPQFADADFVHMGTDPNSWPDPLNVFGRDWDFRPMNPACKFGAADQMGTTLVTMAVFFGDGADPVPGNASPACSITAPGGGGLLDRLIDAGEPVAVAASASDADGEVVEVEFLVDGAVVGTDATSPYAFTLAALPAGTHALVARATDDAGAVTSSAPVTVHGVPLMPGLSWEAEAGLVIAPFAASGGTVAQAAETLDPASGGMAAYRFVVTDADDYTVSMLVDAPAVDANSLFVGIDAMPASPEAIWDIALTVGPEERVVSWRGSGTPDAPESDAKVFTLAAGEHRVYIAGREAGVLVDRVTLALVADEPEPDPEPDPDPTPDPAGDADGDGLTYAEELTHGTDPDLADTDGDGMPDGWEVANGLDPLADDSGDDPDADGLANFAEMDAGTDPLDADSDVDGMPDGWEAANGLDPLADDAQADPDGDGKVNLDEFLDGTDPQVSLNAIVDQLIEQIGIGCLPGAGASSGWALLPLVALCLPWVARRRRQ
jgi:hypothetical protein